MQFFIPALTLLFAAAKLFGAINWSWWLVFSPVIIQAGIMLVLLAIVGITYLALKK